MSGVEALPPEILIQIFRFLELRDIVRLSATCTKFLEICSAPTLWLHLTSVDFTDCAIPHADKIMNIIEKSPNIETLYLGDVIIEDEQHLIEEGNENEGRAREGVVGEDLFVLNVLKKLQHLKNIHLHMSGITNHTVEAICAKQPDIRSVSIHDNRFVSTEAALDLVTHCHNLSHLCLDSCESVVTFQLSSTVQQLNLVHVSLIRLYMDLDNVRGLVASSPRLCHLDLTGVFHLHQFSFAETDNNLAGLATMETLVLDMGLSLREVRLPHCPNLKSISVVQCQLLKELVACCPQLQSLNVEGCVSMETLHLSECNLRHLSCRDLGALTSLNIRAPHLQSLDLSECKLLTSDQVVATVDNKTSLTSLDIRGCTNVNPAEISTHILAQFPCLETLTYGDNSWTSVTLTSETLLQLTISKCTSPNGVQLSMPALQCLMVDKCPNFSEQDLVDSLSYGQQIRRSQGLESLLGPQCKVDPFINGSGTHDLQSLTLKDLPGLHGELLSRSLKLLPHLVDLHLIHCTFISQLHIDGWPSLQNVQVESCSRLNSFTVHRVNSLRAISVKWCSMVQTINVVSDSLVHLDLTGTNTAHLELHCHSLESLSVTGVLTQDSHTAYICCPQLEHLSITKCDRLSDSNLADIIHKCPALSSIMLIGSSTLRHVKVPSSIHTCCLTGHRGVRTITLDNPPRIQHLTLNNLPKFTPDSRQKLLLECQTTLRVLEVRAIPGETTLSVCLMQLTSLTLDQGVHLSHLEIVCPSLQTLRIQGCPRLHTLVLHLSSLPDLQVYHSTPLLALRHLSLTCPTVPDLHNTLSLYCPRLQRLTLKNSRLDYHLLSQLGTSLLYLQTVSLYQCELGTSDSESEWDFRGNMMLLKNGRSINIFIVNS